MKLWAVLPIVVLAIGCSGGSKDAPTPEKSNPDSPIATKSPDSSKKDEAPTTAEQEKFDDSVFKVPAYPGAEIVKFTSMEMDSGLSHSYNRHYKTMDSVDKVAEHYMTEGAKVGKLADKPMMNKPGSLMRIVIIEFGNKEKLQVQVMNVPKGNYTDISVHLITSKK